MRRVADSWPRPRPASHVGSRGSTTTPFRAAFLADLHEVLPGTRGIVEEVVVHRWERGLPYPRVGRAKLQPALTRDLAPVFLAGDYLGTWYTETSVWTGLAAAAGARSTLA